MLLSWCGWHIQVLCNFMKMLTWACYEAFGHHGGTKRVPRRRNKNGATATYPKMMPRQHIGSGSSWRYRRKRKRGVSVSCKMVGVLPTTGFPRVSGMENEWQFEHGANGASHTCKGISSQSSRVIPSKRAFRSGSVHRGSSHSRVVEGSSGSCL